MNQLLQDKKIEGYWYSESEENKRYPVPIPNILTDSEALTIHQLIKIKEGQSYKLNYKGLSTSRITGEFVGCSEYHHPDGWVWPIAFGDHYVLLHKVRPSEEFLKFIGYTK